MINSKEARQTLSDYYDLFYKVQSSIMTLVDGITTGDLPHKKLTLNKPIIFNDTEITAVSSGGFYYLNESLVPNGELMFLDAFVLIELFQEVEQMSNKTF